MKQEDDMAAEEFKAGDVVQLKSGGPKMTVQHTGNGNAVCVWFEGNKKVEGSFNMQGLQVPREMSF